MPDVSPLLVTSCVTLSDDQQLCQGSYNPSLACTSFLKQFRTYRILTYVDWFIMRIITKDTDKEMQEVRYGYRVGLPCPPWAPTLRRASSCSAIRKMSENVFRDFMEASLYGVGN